MKPTIVVLLLGLVLVATGQARADCGDPKSSEEGEVTAFFKNLGCKIKSGAEDLHESAKPWAEKIGTGAKEFGATVADKYKEIKTKLSEDSPQQHPPAAVPLDAPTEKVPLAPLHADNGPAAAAAAAAPQSQPLPATAA